MAEKEHGSAPFAFALLYQKLSSFQAAWLLKIGFPIWWIPLSIESECCLGIFTLCLLRWKDKTAHLRKFGSVQPKGQAVGWGRMEQKRPPTQQDLQPPLPSLIMSAARDCSPVFGVTGWRVAPSRNENRGCSSHSSRCDEANHIVIDRFGLNHTEPCPDRGLQGSLNGEPRWAHGLILPVPSDVPRWSWIPIAEASQGERKQAGMARPPLPERESWSPALR